jgi:plastocyanin
MRKLITLNRRTFGTLLAAKLALFVAPAFARPGQREHHVKIHRFKFEPEDIVVSPGDLVIWENLDLAVHTATGKDGTWSTAVLKKGQSEGVKFENEGKIEYYCKVHPAMKAVITVRA